MNARLCLHQLTTLKQFRWEIMIHHQRKSCHWNKVERLQTLITQAVKDEKATGSIADLPTMLLTEQEEEPPPIICEKGHGDGKIMNHHQQKSFHRGQGEEATDINPEPVKDEKSTGSNAEVSTTLLTGQEEELESEIIIMDIVPPTPQKNITKKKRQLLDCGEQKRKYMCNNGGHKYTGRKGVKINSNS